MARIVSKKLKKAGYKRYMDWGWYFTMGRRKIN